MATISIALTTYNSQKYVAQQLLSIAQQKRLPDEVIVCDDASDDGTWDLILEFSRKAPCPVIPIRNPKTLGITKNFEQAITRCTGTLIALCDSDDVWYPQKLEELECVFEGDDPKAVAAFSDSDLITEEGERTGRTFWERSHFGKSRQRAFMNDTVSTLLAGPIVAGMSLMFSSSIVSVVLPLPDDWHHDAWISIFAALCGSVCFLPQTLQAYRVHPGQNTYHPPKREMRRIADTEKSARYRGGAARYETLLRRLVERGYVSEGDALCSLVACKILHKQRRAAVYAGGKRVQTAVAGLLAGEYRMFGGWRSFVGDLFGLASPGAVDY